MTPPTNQDSPQPTVNTVWARNDAEGSYIWLTTPSGQTCQAMRMGLTGLVKAGVLGESDSLTSLVDKQHIQRVRGRNGVPDTEEINMASLIKDPGQLGKILMMVDRVLPLILKNPIVYRHFTDEKDEVGKAITVRVPDEKREPGAVYTDMIGIEDKMYLFNWTVGGTADAERFSDESGSHVADLVDGEGLPRAARRAAVRRQRRR